MSYLRVTKASSMISNYNPRVSRFQEVYLMAWYEWGYIQVCSYCLSVKKKSKVEQIMTRKYVNIVWPSQDGSEIIVPRILSPTCHTHWKKWLSMSNMEWINGDYACSTYGRKWYPLG